MYNKCYLYEEKVSEDSYKLRDYTSYYYGGLTQEFNRNPDWFFYLDVDDNLKIEQIAYKVYGSENYSDVILACNQEVFLWSMPYSTDILQEQKEALNKIFATELGIGVGDARFEDFQVFLDYIDEDVERRNSKKRKFRLPKKDNIDDIMNLISIYRKNNKITQYEGL